MLKKFEFEIGDMSTKTDAEECTKHIEVYCRFINDDENDDNFEYVAARFKVDLVLCLYLIRDDNQRLEDRQDYWSVPLMKNDVQFIKSLNISQIEFHSPSGKNKADDVTLTSECFTAFMNYYRNKLLPKLREEATRTRSVYFDDDKER